MTQIQRFQNDYKAKWDEYIERAPRGTFFHLTGWKEMIEKTFGFRSTYLMALSRKDVIKGIMPLFLMKDIIGRRYLVSIPYSTYAGICADDKEIKNKLFNKAKELALENKVQYLENRNLNNEVFQLPVKKDFVSMFLKLENDPEYVWKNALNTKARNQVRKANREGLTVDFGNTYLNKFYEILSVNIRDLGSPNYPKLFLKNILEEFSNSSGLIVVKYQEKIIAGMLFVYYKGVLYDPWAASLKQYNKLCPNDILYWEAIKYACSKGCTYFDMGRSTLDSGTFKFKKKWGAEPVQLYYQYFLNKTQKIPVVNAHNNKYQMAINLWKKVPLKIAGILGPRLIKYLPEL